MLPLFNNKSKRCYTVLDLLCISPPLQTLGAKTGQMVKLEFFPDSENNENIHNYKMFPLALIEDPLLELVLNYKQDSSNVTVAEPISLEELIHEHIEDKPVNFPKREVLGEEFTDEDYEKLCTKLKLQSEQFKKHQFRDIRDKVERLKLTFPRLTFEEIFTALKGFDYNEDEVALYLTKTDFITQIRQQIAQFRQNHKKPEKKAKPIECVVESIKESSSDTEEIESSESETESIEESSYSNTNHVQKRSKNTSKKVARLKLDDALANATEMEGWSDARIRAYQSLKSNPNTYFYRFNAPGETQRNGVWSREEHEMFMKRLAEVGADGQWGIFSMTIPGRVGYQVLWGDVKLIEAGSIRDSNYRIDQKGKAHYVGGKTRATGKSITNDSSSEDLEEDAAESEAEEEEEIPTTIAPIVTKAALFYENPLPGFIDAITQTEVVRPAISPYGHVLSYDTWLKCLLNGDRKNTCPLTNQPLHKRQLIFLTFENIEAYRDIIRKE